MSYDRKVCVSFGYKVEKCVFKGKIIKLVKMDFRNDRMWEIIAAYLCGEAVEAADMERLQQWLETGDHRRELRQLERYYKEQSVRQGIDEERAYHSVFGKIREEKRGRRLGVIRWWGAVASIVMLGIVTATVLLRTGAFRPEVLEVAGNDFAASDPMEVVLQLASGQQILLEEDDKLSLPDEYGAVYNRNGVLSFGTACPKGGTGEKYNVLKVPRGKEYQVILPDSTRVWLNADSRLRFPLAFGEKERRVFLEGEAYFDVKKAKDCPFIVETDRIDVEVLGTRFDVKAYSDEETVYTTLLTGSVRIVADGLRDRNVELKPAQQYSLDRKSRQQKVEEVDPSLYVAWMDRMFVFWNQRLEDVMKDLTKWYDVEFVFADEVAADMRISGNIERSRDLTAVLDMITGLRKVEIVQRDGKYVVRAK